MSTLVQGSEWSKAAISETQMRAAEDWVSVQLMEGSTGDAARPEIYDWKCERRDRWFRRRRHRHPVVA